MSHFQFIHAADLHLGAPFVGLHQNHPGLAQRADEATYTAFDNIIQLALARNVLFVLFAGDIYDADYPNLKAQLRFRDGVRQLDKAGIATCVIRGNHDHGGSVRAQLEFPERYFEFAPGANEPHIVAQNDIPVAEIYGYSYPQRAVTENVLHHYNPRSLEQKYFRIGMLHGNVGGDAEHDNYAPCSVTQLKEIAIDYWALGHVHQSKVLSEAPPIVYPGTPQGLSPRETGAHGCYLIEVQDHRATVQFMTTDSLRWSNVELDISPIATEEELLRALEEILMEQREEENCGLIARVDFTGRGPLHHFLQKQQNVRQVEEYLQGQLPEDVFINRLDSSTKPDFDLEKKRHENSILGDYLRLSQNVSGDAQLQEKVLLALSEVADHLDVRHAMDIRRSEEWLTQQLPQLLEEAETRGADLLMGTEG